MWEKLQSKLREALEKYNKAKHLFSKRTVAKTVTDFLKIHPATLTEKDLYQLFTVVQQKADDREVSSKDRTVSPYTQLVDAAATAIGYDVIDWMRQQKQAKKSGHDGLFAAMKVIQNARESYQFALDNVFSATNRFEEQVKIEIEAERKQLQKEIESKEGERTKLQMLLGEEEKKLEEAKNRKQSKLQGKLLELKIEFSEEDEIKRKLDYIYAELDRLEILSGEAYAKSQMTEETYTETSYAVESMECYGPSVSSVTDYDRPIYTQATRPIPLAVREAAAAQYRLYQTRIAAAKIKLSEKAGEISSLRLEAEKLRTARETKWRPIAHEIEAEFSVVFEKIAQEQKLYTDQVRSLSWTIRELKDKIGGLENNPKLKCITDLKIQLNRLKGMPHLSPACLVFEDRLTSLCRTVQTATNIPVARYLPLAKEMPPMAELKEGDAVDAAPAPVLGAMPLPSAPPLEKVSRVVSADAAAQDLPTPSAPAQEEVDAEVLPSLMKSTVATLFSSASPAPPAAAPAPSTTPAVTVPRGKVAVIMT